MLSLCFYLLILMVCWSHIFSYGSYVLFFRLLGRIALILTLLKENIFIYFWFWYRFFKCFVFLNFLFVLQLLNLKFMFYCITKAHVQTINFRQWYAFTIIIWNCPLCIIQSTKIKLIQKFNFWVIYFLLVFQVVILFNFLFFFFFREIF